MAEKEVKTPSGADGEGTPPVMPKKKNKKIDKWVKRGVILAIVAACIGGIVIYNNVKKAREAEAEAVSNTAVISRGDITVKITGSGTVSAIEEYNIIPTVNGEIKADYFNEGDYVNEGDVLYRFDSTVADNAIKTAENQIKTAENQIKTAENQVKNAESQVKSAENQVKTTEGQIKASEYSVISAQNSVDRAETAVKNRADDVEKAQDNIKKLAIYANSTGKVSGINLTVGNSVNGMICTITDTSTMLVKVPFNATQFENIAVGDSVTVSIEKYMTTTSGTVQRKYSAAGTGSDGSVVYDVEILIGRDVDLPEGTIVTATVHTAYGDVTSSLTGSVYYPDSTAVNTEVPGKVQTVYVKNGDWVQKGALIAQLESSDLQDALKIAQQNYTDAQSSLQEAVNNYNNTVNNLDNSHISLDNSRISLGNSQTGLDNAYTSLDNAHSGLEDAKSNLENRKSDAEDYTITAPISGVVLSKNYKAGDTIYGQSSTTLMVIADMTKMKFTISVDELDIASVALGQEVEVTCDALEGVEIVGRITNISQLGTSQNGVTNYPVEVTIDEPGKLMSGMNVSAEIIVAEAANVVRAPISAVNYFNGSYYVTVVGEVDGMTDDRADANSQGGRPEGGFSPDNMPEAAAPGGEADGALQESPASMPMGGTNRTHRNDRGNSSPKITLFDEEQRVEVTVGLSDEDYYEIISGLEVGQVVHNERSTGNGGFFGMMMGGGPGGMGGGGPR